MTKAAQRATPFLLLGAVLLLVILFGRRGDAADDARPLRPADATRVLQKVPIGAHAQPPQNLGDALTQARADIERARAESDPRYLGHAQAALAPWWDLAEPPHDVLVLRATIRQSNHDFTGALADLERALASEPRDPQVWITRATLLQLRGDFAGARASCRALDGIILAACVAGVDGMTGHAEQAYAGLARVFQRARVTDPTIRGWVLTELGELALRRGDRDTAERHFREVLALAPNPYLLATYADFLLDARRPAEVVTLLQDHTAADNLLLRLVEAEAALDAPGFAEHRGELAARYAQSRARGDQIHLREEARFTLHVQRDAVTALRLALADWEIQKEPADLRLVLEAALAAGDRAAAAPVLQFLDASGLEDPTIRALAGSLR